MNIFYVYSSGWVGELSLKWANLSAIYGPITSRLWLRYWNALIHTTPAFSMDQRKTESQQSLVEWNNAKGKVTIEGRNIKARWIKRMISLINLTILEDTLTSS